MLFKSPLITAASGKIAGLVASHNAAGQYLRALVIPVNPNTSFQQTVRNYFAQLAAAWNDTLTAAQRSAWDTYGANVAMTGKLGDQVYLTGQNHYIRSNVPRLQAGLPRVDDGPTIFTVGSFVEPTFTASEATQLMSIAFDDTEDWCDEPEAGLLVWGARPKSPTINYFKGPYLFADSLDGNAMTPPSTPETMTWPYAFVEDQKLYARFTLSRADGRLSYTVRSSATAAA